MPRTPRKNVSRLGWNYSGAAASRIVFTSCGCGELVGGGCGLLGGGCVAHGVHLLRVRWVGGLAGAGYSGAAASRIVFTSLRWRGRWVVSASYSGVMVVRMVFTSWRSAVGRRGGAAADYSGMAVSRMVFTSRRG